MKFARRMESFENNELLALMQLVDNPEIISFAGGFPAPELFPLEELKKISEKVLSEENRCALQYSSTSGYLPLREKIASRMNKKMGVNLNSENILITSGSQQALDMSGMVFLDEGDIIFCERPSYLGAMNAFNSYYPQFVEIETDDDGMIISDLKDKLKKYKEEVKMIYVIPDFQNPTSRCWSKERRLQFLNILDNYDIPIVEDGAYSEIRFQGEAEPSLFSLDKRNKVVYIGSFSKIFCPGFRVAWLAGSSNIISKYLALKPGVDLSSSSISQRYIDQYLNDFNIDVHIKRTLESYKEKRDFVAKKMQEEFPAGVRYNIPKGGLFFWLILPYGKNAKDLLQLALKENVAFVPGGSFFANDKMNNTIRLNFSNMTIEKIDVGITRLSKVLKKFLF